ncbi:PspC domain-containing protein [uncultured Dokdonia sp.]|uniref:PspC domain-containing protein n=1 Tax=uncultured Dokdonia sp. TaxID=575653 RepID=UPI00260B8228|nr:PspC domain-containing protein [uncultured Dokdonia sp.]
MNKTVNINLAGIFFHIDEDAYAKLQRYLTAIKRSFEGVTGEDEIIADIEARISELFSAKIQDARQVISTKELDEVIAVMGQPEDYMVDDDIFEDAPKSKKSKRTQSSGSGKKLYRDVDNAYIGGVSSGLGHYFGVDSIWIRLAWVFLVLVGFGSPILIYILLWILMPEATSTADKLSMTGKAVNIDNIQEKVKEGFENVADAVKNVDYDKYGNQAKKGAQGFFQTIGKIIMFFLKVLAKIIGVLFIITGAAVVISLFVGLFTAGTFDIFYGDLGNYGDYIHTAGIPLWLASLLTFFAVGIPFFFLFYLGLKILAGNLKSMPLAGKLSLLGIWLLSVIGLGVIGIREATEHSFTGKVTTQETLAITTNDTLTLRMQGSDLLPGELRRSSSFLVEYDNNGERVYMRRNVRLIVRSTTEDNAYLKIQKETNGRSFSAAKEEASRIDYNFEVIDNTLYLDGFFTTVASSKFRNQEVQVILYLPEGTTLYADENTYSYHRNNNRYRDLLDNGNEEKFLHMKRGKLVCDTCTEQDNSTNYREDDWEQRSYEEGQEIPDWERDESTENTDWKKDTLEKSTRERDSI